MEPWSITTILRWQIEQENKISQKTKAKYKT